MNTIYFLLLSTLMQGLATPPNENILDCNDFTYILDHYQDPEAMRSGSGVTNDMWIVYEAKKPFAHAKRTTISYWNFGKLSNVIATFGEYLNEEDAIALYEKMYTEFKACYPEAVEESNDYGPRSDLSMQLNNNLYARLTIYYFISDDGEQEGWSVYFDISNLGE